MEFTVLFDFNAELETDLQLTTGESIKVLEKGDDSGKEAWWKGENSDGDQGWFPSNYVTQKKPELPPRPNAGRVLPPTPVVVAAAAPASKVNDNDSESESDDDVVLAPPSTIDDNNDASSSNRPISMYGTPLEKGGYLDFETSKQMGSTFSIESLDSFDSLMNDGYCIEISKNSGSGVKITEGSRVTMNCRSLTWDGAATTAHQFCEGNLSITMGKLQASKVLDLALVSLSVGDEAAITGSPALCYGAIGYPPLVPPNSHIVYFVKITSVDSTGTGASEAPTGPKEILSTHNFFRPSEATAGIAEEEEQRGVVFVSESNEKLTSFLYVLLI